MSKITILEQNDATPIDINTALCEQYSSNIVSAQMKNIHPQIVFPFDQRSHFKNAVFCF